MILDWVQHLYGARCNAANKTVLIRWAHRYRAFDQPTFIRQSKDAELLVVLNTTKLLLMLIRKEI